MQLEHYSFNQILQYEDHSAMMSSIEMRSPFVDYRLMEFAFRLPDRLKFSTGVTKRIQREAFSKTLPKSIVDSHQKIGFSTPFLDWMKDPKIAEYMRNLINGKDFQSRKSWQGVKVKNRFENAEKHPNFPFWRFINIELWAQAYKISNL
jgi:asparagine synthase (glutamine-hydrolysing)